MSLQVWLPLNGDLRNQGISNIQPIASNTTIEATGKIGSCYSFNGINSQIQLNHMNLAGWKQISISCWINPAIETWYLFLVRGNSQHRIRINYYSFEFRNSKNSTQREITWAHTLPLNTWSHITVTYDQGHVKLYINGILDKEDATYYNSSSTLLASDTDVRIGRQQSTSDNLYLSGKINDFRIYDHCLSAAEVKEISQGLVLHYKLDSINSNLIEDSSGYNHNGTCAGAVSIYEDTPRYTQCVNLSAGSSRINCGRGGMVTDSITVNFWANLPTIPSAISDRNAIISCTESGGFRIQIGDNACLRSIIYISSAYAIIDGETALQPNTWYMMTLVYDRLNGKLYEYLNGEKEAEVDVGSTGNIGYHKTNVIWIGVEARSATSYYSALAEKISDFRIYCTALDADAIRQLYEVSAKVDNLQNLHTFELVENNLKTEINKRGQLICNELNEDTATKFYKSGNLIETNEIIEC